MHDRRHEFFAPVATSAVRCRRQRMSALLPRRGHTHTRCTAPTVNMEAIETRSDSNGAAAGRPRQDVPSEAVAAAPLARPREEEARACVIVECVRASRANCFRAHRLKPPSLSRSRSMTVAPLAMPTRCLSQSRRVADAWRRSRPIRSPRRGVRAQRRSPRTRIGTLGPGATIVLGGDGAT